MNPLTTITQNYPILSEQEERTLFLRYKEHNDLEAAHKLVLSCTPMVISVANKFRGYVNDIRDLHQEGYIGLCRAVQSYDPSYGVRLAYYAITKIKERIVDFVINNWTSFKIATTKAQRKLFFNRELLEKDPEAYKQLGVSKEQYEDFEQKYAARHGEDTDGELLQLTSNSLTPEESLIEKQDQLAIQKLKDSLSLLGDREQFIIRSRYLTETPRTLQDIGAELGVSLQRVKQIEIKALGKLRDMMK